MNTVTPGQTYSWCYHNQFLTTIKIFSACRGQIERSLNGFEQTKLPGRYTFISNLRKLNVRANSLIITHSGMQRWKQLESTIK